MKKKTSKRLLALVLAMMLMVVSSVPVMAAAGKPKITQSQTDTSSGKLYLKLACNNCDGVRIKSKNLKTGKSGTTYTRYDVVGLNAAKASTWFKSTLTGYQTRNGRKYYGSSRTTYLATSPVPSAKLVSNRSTRVKLTWKKAYGSTGYMVYMRTGNGSFRKVATTKGTSWTTSSLKHYTNYSFYVRSYKKVSGKTYYSAMPTGARKIYITKRYY